MSEIAGAYGKKLPIVFQSSCIPLCISISNDEGSCCSTSSPAFVIGLDLGHSNRYVVVSHYYFNLNFPYDI